MGGTWIPPNGSSAMGGISFLCSQAEGSILGVLWLPWELDPLFNPAADVSLKM